jgi:hypothetical protein
MMCRQKANTVRTFHWSIALLCRVFTRLMQAQVN